MVTNIIIAATIAFCVGAVIGFAIGNKKASRYDGEILLDKNDEGTDRVIFKLGMDYDDLTGYDRVVFNVVKKL